MLSICLHWYWLKKGKIGEYNVNITKSKCLNHQKMTPIHLIDTKLTITGLSKVCVTV